MDLSGKTCVVTGANTGIGLETARALAKAGATTVMAARNVAKGKAAVADVKASTGSENVELLQLDLADTKSIEAAAKSLIDSHESLHVLVNNAGLMTTERSTTADGFETMFGVNHLGHFLLTRRLEPLLKAAPAARVVNVSSEAHRAARSGMPWDDLMSEKSFSGMRVYGESKLANILFAREHAKRLEGTNVVTSSLHPGVINSRFGKDGDTGGAFALLLKVGAPFLSSTAKGARTSIYCATTPALETETGQYYKSRKRARPTRFGRDDEAAKRLWAISEELLGL